MLRFLPEGDSLLGDGAGPTPAPRCGETRQARPRPSLATEVPVPAPLSGSLQEPGDLPPSPGSLPFHIST